MLHITVVQYKKDDRQTQNMQGKKQISEKKNQYKNLFTFVFHRHCFKIV